MNKLKNLLNEPLINVLLTLTVLIVSWFIIYSANLFSSSGLGAFLLIGFPTVVAFFTIGIYFIIRFFTKKYNWLVTLVSIIYLLYYSINYYLK